LSEKKITVEVAGAKEELERMKKEMEKITKEHAEEKTRLEAEVAKGKEDAKEKEKLAKTLKDLADKEFAEKKQELLNRVEQDKENLGEERYDDLVERINAEEFGPPQLDATMQMLDFLNDAITSVKEKYKPPEDDKTKQKAKISSGSAWRNEKDPNKKAEYNEAINNIWRKIWRTEVDSIRTGARTFPDSKMVLDKETENFLKEKEKMRGY